MPKNASNNSSASISCPPLDDEKWKDPSDPEKPLNPPPKGLPPAPPPKLAFGSTPAWP
jgi:hypothetical protein